MDRNVIDLSSMTLEELENLFTEHSTNARLNRSQMTKEEASKKFRFLSEIRNRINDLTREPYEPPAQEMPPGHEPEGYFCEPGYVKSNPENNDFYVDKLTDWAWYPAIKQCHETLNELIPGYNIDQIKTKFGQLCFYFTFPEEIAVQDSPSLDTVDKVKKAAWSAVRTAEMWVAEYEVAKLAAITSSKSSKTEDPSVKA